MPSFPRVVVRLFLPVLVLSILLPAVVGANPAPDSDQEANRAKLLSYVLRQQLSRHHYSHKAFDDELSRAAFELYLKQLDFQKRFLLQKDVDRLQNFADKIDDEINKGQLKLPVLAGRILTERIGQAEELTVAILKTDFDFSKQEEMETDAEKLEWCKTREELRERWRKTLKFQVMNRILVLEEKETDKKEKTEPNAKPLQQQAMEKVGLRFEHLFTRLLKDTERDHYDRYFNAVTRAFDPHTTYFPPKQKEDFEIGMRGSLEGIGATLREEDGFIKVVRIIPGSAAARQGELDSEDIILAVAQDEQEPVDVTDTRLRDAVELIRGPKGTEGRLTVRKADGKRKVIPIVRDVVEIEETFVKWTTLPTSESKRSYGYVKIPSFYRDFKSTFNGGSGRNVTDDVEDALEGLKKKKIDGLVLDLRNNGGGALTDAVKISGLFLPKGPMVQVKSSNGKVKVLTDRSGGTIYDGPLVVLVNQFSASASEILAAALQDYGRAYIIGSVHTYGKGTVQTILDLDRAIPFRNMDKYKPLGALKVTTQKFYRVSGGSTQERGVSSDLVLPDRMQHIESGEKYMDYVLPWDTVTEAEHDRWQNPGIDLNNLRSKSRQRLASNEDFLKIEADSDKAKQRRDQTKLTLNLIKAREKASRDLKEFENSAAHQQVDEADEKSDGKLTEKEKFQRWVKKVGEDPHTREASEVLDDLHRLAPLANTANNQG